MLSQKLIVNTKWQISHDHKSNIKSEIFTFNPNGSISVENDKSKVATWTISGDTLIIKYNNGYVDLRGRLVNNNITGKALNKRGVTWGFVLKSLSPSAIKETTKTPEIIGTEWNLKLSNTTDFNKAFGKRHLKFINQNTATLFNSDGKEMLGTIRWYAKANEITVTIGTFARYIGKIENNIYKGELTNNKGQKVFFVGNRQEITNKGIDLDKTVFLDEKYSDPNKFHFLDYYQKYWLDGVKNPAFDNHSSNILNLKKNENAAINYFYNKLNPLISNDEMVICYVPSSDPDNQMSGVRKLCAMIAKNKERIDGTHCIVRYKKIEKLANGGDRSIQVHLNSLKIESAELIRGKNILLLDDVTTTNNSLKACKQLLANAGANNVYCFALGQTS